MKKISFLCVFLVGCSLLQSGGLLTRPEITFVDAVPHSFTLTGCKVDIKLQAKNPNTFAINLDKMDVLLYINDQKTVSAEIDNISLKAKETCPLNTTVVVPYTSIGMAAIGALQGKSGLKYKVEGVAHYKSPFGVIKFPVTIYKNK